MPPDSPGRATDVQLSVVIPTFNRSENLSRTVSALRNQTLEAGSYEVLIVDDGSKDDTAERVRKMQQDYPTPLFYFYQQNRKQGAARNLGAASARGDLLVFLGDDIVPTDSFLQEHLHEHQKQAKRAEDASKVVVIGYTTWPPDLRCTPFLEYIGEQGWQFGFSLIEDPEDVDFNYFYSSNVSIDRRFFLESGGFDEHFKEYGWEDIELSLRLKKRGMELVYCPDAIAYHHHETCIASFSERQRKVGHSAWSFYHQHPDMAEFLGIDRIPDYSRSDRLKFWLLDWLCRRLESSRHFTLSRYYPDLMTYYYVKGLIEAREADCEQGNVIPAIVE